MKLLVLGAGGIGGYFGGRLAEGGADVTFLVRPGRGEQIRKDGLRIQSPRGDLRLPVNTVFAESLQPGYDLVLFTCKAYDLASAMEAIEPVMDGTCAVVPLLNGLAHFDALDRRFGKEQVMGGTCQIDVTLRQDGLVFHAGTLQRLLFGERDRRTTARAQALATVLANSTIDWTLSQDIEQDVWEKMVFLSALAATTCLFRANVREIIAAPGGCEAMERALAANIEVAAREGHPPRPDAVTFARDRLTDPAGTWSASMLRDAESGKLVESDHIVGWMLDRARAHGADDTILALAYTHLRAYEARKAARRLPGN
jgi:2-dehydropantoate 2-reductase